MQLNKEKKEEKKEKEKKSYFFKNNLASAFESNSKINGDTFSSKMFIKDDRGTAHR